MLRTRVFTSHEELDVFSLGGLSGGHGQSLDRLQLDGLTLTFTNPSGSVTFSDPGRGGLTLKEAADQVQAVPELATVILKRVSGTVVLYEASPTAGIKLAADQAARAVLGFPKSGTIEGKILQTGNSPIAPRLVSMLYLDGKYVLTYDDQDDSSSIAPSSASVSIANPAGGTTALDPPSRSIYVGGAGDLVVHLHKNAPGVLTTFTGVATGRIIPVVADSVDETTTATDLVCLL